GSLAMAGLDQHPGRKILHARLYGSGSHRRLDRGVVLQRIWDTARPWRRARPKEADDPVTELTLRITGKAETGFEISCVRGAPDARGRAVRDQIPVDAFQPGNLLNSEGVTATLGNQAHSVAALNAIGEAIASVFFTGKVGEVWTAEREKTSTEYAEWS